MREFLEVGRIETADGQEVVDLSATSGVLALPEG
jgi:hypothetical protein